MATEKQIAANRRNAQLSSGPRTEAGKIRSRANATTHGLAAESAGHGAESNPEFADRRARWAAEQQPKGEAAGWALDRVVAATFRIERCERALDDLLATTRQRALLTWDQDRAVEASVTYARLARDPVLASRQLQTTAAGVGLLIQAWLGLIAALEGGQDWSESDVATALDLLGIDPALRSGRTVIDPTDEVDRSAYRRELAFEELGRLRSLRDEALIPLDAMERRRAMAGDAALLSKPAKLLFRYERDAWKRYEQSMKEVQAPPTAAEAPAPVVVEAPPIEPTGPHVEPEPESAPVASHPRPAADIPAARPIEAAPQVIAPERTQFFAEVAADRATLVALAG